MKNTLRLRPHADIPSTLQVEITSHCNLKCQMCPLTDKKTLSSQPPGHIEERVWKKILPVARDIGKSVIAGYGEPLMNRNCIPLLKDLNSLDVGTGISTNGIALTPQLAEQLVALPHLIHINLSIDSPDPEIYRELRRGELDKALKGLENLMAAMDDPDRVTVSSILMNKTLAGLSAFPGMLSKLGVKRYFLQGLIDHNAELHHENLLFHQEIAHHIEALKEACQQAGVELFFSLPQRLDMELREPIKARTQYFGENADRTDFTRQCFIPWEIPYIDKDGRIFPCCNACIDEAWVMGDLREESFADIWQGARYQKFRQHLLDGRTIPDICRHCTTVPLGEHPLHRYAAKILFERSGVYGENELCLVVQNTGTSEWTRKSAILIGTTNSRDRTSTYFHPSWPKDNRLATCIEEIVPPGETATFRFQLTPSPDAPSELFQLLIEGHCWLPDTCFEINSGKGRESLILSSGKKLLPRFLSDKLERWLPGIGKRLKPPSEDLLRPYSAKVLLEKSILCDREELCVVVQNVGTCYWTQETQLMIGTADPKDRESVYYHPSWSGANRITTFTEDMVPPGGSATFRFQITSVTEAPIEVFQLVVEGKGWLSDTCFEICSKDRNTTTN